MKLYYSGPFFLFYALGFTCFMRSVMHKNERKKYTLQKSIFVGHRVRKQLYQIFKE